MTKDLAILIGRSKIGQPQASFLKPLWKILKKKWRAGLNLIFERSDWEPMLPAPSSFP
jgi:hypothetical protein